MTIFRRLFEQTVSRLPLARRAQLVDLTLSHISEVSYYRLWKQGFRPGSIIDIGAYQGEWTRLAAKLFLDKVNKRIRDEHIAELLSRADLAKRVDFEGDSKSAPKKLTTLEKLLKGIAKERALKEVKLRFEEEHSLWELSFVNSQGAEHVITGSWRPRRNTGR